MEPESEKMDALQKVYAELILNTTTEAAGRIMVAERKALSFQRNAESVKQEALNMLLRLKRVTDAKIAELEMTTSRQKSKIEELEAQLHEAEDVVTDLRAELREVQEELENMKKSQAKLSDEQTTKSSAASYGNSSQLSEQNASEAVSLPLPDAGHGLKDERTVKSPASQGNSSQPNELNAPEAVSVPLLDAECEFEDASFDWRKSSDNYCIVSQNAPPTKSAVQCPVETHCAANPDLASIIMTSKEPELYRNRCTQRIRAYEDGKLSLPVDKDDQNLNIKNRLTVAEDEKDEVTCILASQGQQNMEIVGKKQTELVESQGQDSSCSEGQDVKSLRRISSRRSKSRYRNPVIAPCANQVQTCPASMSTNTHPCPSFSIAESEQDLSGRNQEVIQTNLKSHLQPVSPSSKKNTNPLPGVNENLDKTEAVNVQTSTVEDAVLVDIPVVSRLEGNVEGSLGVENCWLNYEEFDRATDTTSKDVQTCNSNNEAPSHAANEGLKYTFHRKRKKGSSNCPDESECQEKGTLKKISAEKQIGGMESEKSNLIMESSRENRRLAQVARQLISLSEKRR